MWFADSYHPGKPCNPHRARQISFSAGFVTHIHVVHGNVLSIENIAFQRSQYSSNFERKKRDLLNANERVPLQTQRNGVHLSNLLLVVKRRTLDG